jgi:hypothetical protein
MSIQDQVFGMSSGAREVLEKLFLFGPRLDGDIPSKAGRSDLVELGYCNRWEGWNWLSEAGVKFAVEVMLMEGKKERWLEERSSAIHAMRHPLEEINQLKTLLVNRRLRIEGLEQCMRRAAESSTDPVVARALREALR